MKRILILRRPRQLILILAFSKFKATLPRRPLIVGLTIRKLNFKLYHLDLNRKLQSYCHSKDNTISNAS